MRWTFAVMAAVVVLLGAAPARAGVDPPELSSWLVNLDGHTGYGGLPADVQQVRYSASAVYVNASGIPAYTIGPWPGNPNVPSNQGWLFKIPRAPVVNTGTLTSTPLGSI